MKNFRNVSQLGDALLVKYCIQKFGCKDPNPSFFSRNKEQGLNEVLVRNKDTDTFKLTEEIRFPEEEILFWSTENGITKVVPREGFTDFLGALFGQIKASTLQEATHIIHKKKYLTGSEHISGTIEYFVYEIFRFHYHQRGSIAAFAGLLINEE